MRLSNWWKRHSLQRHGRLTAIFISDAAGQPMRPLEQAEALADHGLRGDRYASASGFWQATDACQLTLIHAEHLQRAERRSGIPLSDGRHRRNLVVEGLSAAKLEGCTLRIGDALFAWHRPRPPCGWLDRVSGQGTAKALGQHAGICLLVQRSGVIRAGDTVVIVD